jgi:hypothetical protein
MPLELVASPGTLYRVGRWPNPFVWRRPRTKLLDELHPHDGYRWDAPEADFATMYCATEPVGSFVETLANYRRDDYFAARLHAATNEDEPDAEYAFDAIGGVVPRGYFDRVLGRATLDPEHDFIDVDHPRTHAQLTQELPNLLVKQGAREFDRGVMMTQDRRITRTVAGHLYAQTASTAAGIRYESRLHRDLECWALWEHCAPYLTDHEVDPLTADHPEIRRAAELLKLQLPSG